MKQAKNIELLQLEMDILWGFDAYGRFEPHPLAAIAVADDGHLVRFGPDVPDDLRQQLSAYDPAVTDARAGEANQPPPMLKTCRELLAPLAPIHVSGGLSYVFDSPATLAVHSVPSNFRIVTSGQSIPSTLAAARPEGWWTPQEWEDLLAGRLGPWAIGITADRVAALCHTPVASSTAAEAGVWTHPEERGRGYASIVTAAWAIHESNG